MLSSNLVFLQTFPLQNENRIVSKEWSQPAFTCSKLTTETLEQGVKYVQS